MKTYFITGSSGFIGSNLAKRILNEEDNVLVIGLDNMNNYYDVKIKEWRLAQLNKFDNFTTFLVLKFARFTLVSFEHP